MGGLVRVCPRSLSKGDQNDSHLSHMHNIFTLPKESKNLISIQYLLKFPNFNIQIRSRHGGNSSGEFFMICGGQLSGLPIILASWYSCPCVLSPS